MLLDHLPKAPALVLLAGLTALGVADAGLNDRATAPEEAYKVVLAFEHSLQALPTKEARIDATRKFFDGLPDAATKIEAVGMFDSRYVYVVPKEAAGEILGKLLKDGDVKVRVCAAHALGYLGKGGDHFDALVALLKDVDADGMQDVLYAMVRAVIPASYPTSRLSVICRPVDPHGRGFRANQMLPATCAATSPLCSKTPRQRSCASAIDSLSQLGDDADTPRIREMLGDPSDLVRTRAAVMLAFRKGDETVQVLAAKLDDAAPSVRAAAALSLGELKATQITAPRCRGCSTTRMSWSGARRFGWAPWASRRGARAGGEVARTTIPCAVRPGIARGLGRWGRHEGGASGPRRSAGRRPTGWRRSADAPPGRGKRPGPDKTARRPRRPGVVDGGPGGRANGSRSLLPELRRRRDKAEGDLREQLWTRPFAPLRTAAGRSNAPAASGPR